MAFTNDDLSVMGQTLLPLLTLRSILTPPFLAGNPNAAKLNALLTALDAYIGTVLARMNLP